MAGVAAAGVERLGSSGRSATVAGRVSLGPCTTVAGDRARRCATRSATSMAKSPNVTRGKTARFMELQQRGGGLGCAQGNAINALGASAGARTREAAGLNPDFSASFARA